MQAILSKVSIKGKDVRYVQMFHYTKTNCIGEREIFIPILKYNLSGSLLIAGINPNDRNAALKNLAQKVCSATVTQAG